MSDQEPAIQVETVIVRLRRHGRRLTLPVIALIVIAGASGYWVGALPEPWMNWAAGGAAILLTLVFGIGPILSWLAERVIVTNRRVIIRQGLFVHRRAEVPINRVREVRSRRGPVQRMFGSGDVELLVGAEPPTVLRDVPASMLLVDALQELIERDYLRSGTTGQGFPGAFGSFGSSNAGPSGSTAFLPN